MQLKACINRFSTYVDRKKDQERPYLFHLGKRLQLLLHHPHQQPSCILARSQRRVNGWYMTHRSFTVNYLAKITHINAQLITLSDEKSGTMLYKGLQLVLQKIKDNQFCQLSVKPKVNVSCQLNFRRFVSCQLNFWALVSCQLTSSRPSYKSLSFNNFSDLRKVDKNP